jgi:prolyl oligopeptidase
VEGGFQRPEAKGSLTWRDADSVYVATDFGEGSMTTSGYARIVKLWTRGTPMASATTVYEGKPEDLGVAAYRDHTPGFERDFVWRGFAFYNNELYLRGPTAQLRKIDAPNSAEKGVHREWLTLQLREPLTEAARPTRPARCWRRLRRLHGRQARLHRAVHADRTTSLAARPWTRDHLLLNVLDDVKSRIEVLIRTAGRTGTARPAGRRGIVDLPSPRSTTNLERLLPHRHQLPDADLAVAGRVGAMPEVLKQMPAFFDASGSEVSQHFAKSRDGTRIPYFMVSPKGLRLTGPIRRCCTATAASRCR